MAGTTPAKTSGKIHHQPPTKAQRTAKTPMKASPETMLSAAPFFLAISVMY
jgi:hypothetical protein